MSYLTHHKFPLPLDRDQVAQDWRQRGYSCDVFADPPGREWNDFVHATNELVAQSFTSIPSPAYGKERVVVRRRGKEIAEVVPIDDLRLL
jgi:hypothetical protein